MSDGAVGDGAAGDGAGTGRPPPPVDGPPADGPPPLPAEALPRRGPVSTWVRRGVALAAVAGVLGAAASLTGGSEQVEARTVTPTLAAGCERVSV